MEPKWLKWARALQAIAQNGLTYTSNGFDTERYEAVRAIAAEMMASGSELESEAVLELFALEVGHATPKVDVRGGVFKDGKILMVREIADGRWTLPGGWADANETPSEAAVREVFEESGYKTKAVKLAAVFDRSKHAHTPPFPYHVYKLFFLCELLGGEPAVSIETDGADFFPQGQLPELSISRVTGAQIARLFAHHRQPELPTDFD
jgi:ADP-ribose pyrophosphatase YjhB (NUDIX family)